jgi:hypothetical protein
MLRDKSCVSAAFGVAPGELRITRRGQITQLRCVHRWRRRRPQAIIGISY